LLLPLQVSSAVVIDTSQYLISFLPNRSQCRLRFWMRRANKWAYHTKKSTELRLHQHPIHLRPGLFKRNKTDQALASVLLGPVLERMASNLHYVDILRLSLASKRIRKTVFPPLEYESRRRAFRLHSCGGNGNSKCWSCAIQICNVSSTSTSRSRTRFEGILGMQQPKEVHEYGGILTYATVPGSMLEMHLRDTLFRPSLPLPGRPKHESCLPLLQTFG
jgi:hypothetical protein